MLRLPRRTLERMIFYPHPWPVMFILMTLPIGYILFSRYPVTKAVLLLAFGSTLFLPELAYVKFPMIPPLNKRVFPYLVILFSILLLKPKELRRFRPFSVPLDALLLVLVYGGYMTGVTNADPITVGGYVTRQLPGLNIKDGMFIGLVGLVDIGLPYLIGRSFVQTREELRTWFRVIIAFALVYVIPILWESRMSPNLHLGLYGYRAHPDFLQTIRWGGYRPEVFMIHGLATSLFMTLAMFHVIAWRRTGERIRMVGGRIQDSWMAPGLAAIIVWCRSTATIMYVVFLGPIAAKLSPKVLMRLSLVLVSITLVYPLLRLNDYVPVETILDLIKTYINPEKAQSIGFRFFNEGIMLEHARARSTWGWGTYGRNLVYSPWLNASIPDGYWIVQVSAQGVVGFASSFLLLIWPVIKAWWLLDKIPDRADRYMVAGMTFALSIAIFDLIPNGLFSNYTYLMAGALYGVTHYLSGKKGRAAYRREKEAAMQGPAMPAPYPYPYSGPPQGPLGPPPGPPPGY